MAFCQRWQVSELALFGSVLRDDFKPDSDLDVLISFSSDAQHFGKSQPDEADDQPRQRRFKPRRRRGRRAQLLRLMDGPHEDDGD